MELSPNIHLIEGGMSNAYLIYEPDGLTLIDTGTVDTVEPVMRLIKALGKEISDLKRIVLTHRHIDHVGGAAALRKASSARVWAPQPDAKAIQDDPKSTFPFGPVGLLMRVAAGSKLTPPPCPVDETLIDGTSLPVLGGLRVVWTPGHTTGHSSLFHEERRILFAGDALQTLGGKARVSFPFVCDDYMESCRTIRDKIAPLKADHIYAGHGAPVQGGGASQLERLAMRYAGL